MRVCILLGRASVLPTAEPGVALARRCPMEGSSADVRLDRDEQVLGELREGCHARDYDAHAVFDSAFIRVSQVYQRLGGALRDNEQRDLHVGGVARPRAGGIAAITSSAIDKPEDAHNAGPR